MTPNSDQVQPTWRGNVEFSRKEQLIELSVFLFLIVPSMVLSIFAVRQGSLDFVLTATATILRDLALVGLILFFVWRNGESFRQLGWSFKSRWKDIGIGIILFIPLFFGAGYLDRFLRDVGFSAPSTPQPSSLTAQGSGEYVLAFVLVLIIALAEETIFRGYLLLRFKGISLDPVISVLLSAFVFSLGHGYEGAAGVITVGAMGIVLALVYQWRGSLVAPITMHFLQDFLAIILVPLLNLR